MSGLHKSKRVSWASDIDLCQETKRKTTATSNMGVPSHNDNFRRHTTGGCRSIGGKGDRNPWLARKLTQISPSTVRLFLSEESPSQVSLKAQDHLQAKTSLLVHPSGAGSEDILPPGFEGTHPSSQLQIKASQIPVIKWAYPPKIVLNLTWQVMAGEESNEVDDQNQREMGVFEAIYPRPSSIPTNPSVSTDVEDSQCIDDQIALIPITPIEDEDAAADASSDSMSPFDVPLCLEPHSIPPGISKGSDSPGSLQLAHVVDSDVAAASVALTNIMKSNEYGIDHELLNKILSNPELIENLVRDYGTTNNLQYVASVRSSPGAFSHPSIPLNQADARAPSSTAFSASPSYPPQTGAQVGPVPPQWFPSPAVSPVTVSSSPVGAPPAKDLNYYKSLIHQHGGERQETLASFNNHHIQQPVANQEIAHNSRSREPKPKIMKPCIFFNSSRGCRNGADCKYQHDAGFQPRGSAVPGLQSSKRMKMDSEISS